MLGDTIADQITTETSGAILSLNSTMKMTEHIAIKIITNLTSGPLLTSNLITNSTMNMTTSRPANMTTKMAAHKNGNSVTNFNQTQAKTHDLTNCTAVWLGADAPYGRFNNRVIGIRHGLDIVYKETNALLVLTGWAKDVMTEIIGTQWNLLEEKIVRAPTVFCRKHFYQPSRTSFYYRESIPGQRDMDGPLGFNKEDNFSYPIFDKAFSGDKSLPAIDDNVTAVKKHRIQFFSAVLNLRHGSSRHLTNLWLSS
jgi:hypothetical protein